MAINYERIRDPHLRDALNETATELQNLMGAYPIAGKTYYVSKQGNNSNGSSWANAYTTLAAAITASNAYVAVYTNVMNRIYVDGGSYTESLVAFPNHCEMIGAGIPSDGPRVNGSVVLTSAVSVCHFYKMQFRSNTVAPIVDMSDVSAQGVEFHNCLFNNQSGVAATVGIVFGTGNYYNKVIGCSFIGNPNIVTGIQLEGPLNAFMLIQGNFISAITNGILLDDPTTSDYQCYIKDNIICRSDPNSSDQLAYGIKIEDTETRTDLMTIHNYISAADAIYDAGTQKLNNHIANEVVEATVANQETKYS